MNTEAIIATACVLAGLILAYPLGFYAGKAKGVALGWQDGYFKRIADDRTNSRDGANANRRTQEQLILP